MGEFIDVQTLDNAQTFRAYLAVPASGYGPGLVVGQEIFGINANMRAVADHYAQEGYVVLVPDLFWRMERNVDLGYTQEDFAKAIDLFQRMDVDLAVNDIAACFARLETMSQVNGNGLGYVGFCMGGKLAFLTATRTNAACSVGYYGMGIENYLDEVTQIEGRLVLHFAENDDYCDVNARDQISAALKDNISAEMYVYPGVGHAFARAASDHFDKPAALMAHERTIAALKREIGPHFNLSDLWDEHVKHEFDTRDVPATMATMVAEPYVNHIPTMTGGVGSKQLSRFYQHHFVHGNPPDMKLIPLSRTVGALQIVDEFIMSFTHTTEIDWLLPNVAPTGKYVEIPMLGVVRFCGDKLYHEHIYWDEASVLVQVGLLNPQGLPVAGVATAQKLLDETLPSNTMMNNWKNSEPV